MQEQFAEARLEAQGHDTLETVDFDPGDNASDDSSLGHPDNLTKDNSGAVGDSLLLELFKTCSQEQWVNYFQLHSYLLFFISREPLVCNHVDVWTQMQCQHMIIIQLFDRVISSNWMS